MQITRDYGAATLVPDAYPTTRSRDATADLALPAVDTKRWSSRRKAAVVVATRGGVITRDEALRRYMLSEEEFAAWETAFDRSGIPGLRIANRYAPRLLFAKR